MYKILIVEDDLKYRETLASAFDKAGFEVEQIESPVKGLEKVALTKYDAVISDLNLPFMSGVMFVETVKNISPTTVCIILTGDPDEQSEIQSIENNIDLYIEKIKPMSVIIKYIEKLLKERNENELKDVVLVSKSENIVLNTQKYEVTKNDEKVKLTPTEYELLKLLLVNKNQMISRDYILENAWRDTVGVVEERLVDSHIKNLRDKLKSTSIITVRGYGYRWNEVE